MKEHCPAPRNPASSSPRYFLVLDASLEETVRTPAFVPKTQNISSQSKGHIIPSLDLEKKSNSGHHDHGSEQASPMYKFLKNFHLGLLPTTILEPKKESWAGQEFR